MAKTNIAVPLVFLVLSLLSTSGLSDRSGLSRQTMDAIESIFQKSEVTWDDRVRFRIQNLLPYVKTLPFSKPYPFIEGDVAKIRLLIAQGATLVAVFIDGNAKPLVASIVPGTSMWQAYVELHGKADNDCNGYYSLVVVQRVNNKLLANRIAFRTFTSDCE